MAGMDGGGETVARGKVLWRSYFKVDKRIRRGQNFSQPTLLAPMPAMCKHPQVRVVAREEDVEFVECQTCGEVFDSAEFKDILNEDEGEALGDEA
jgi:hypothetical protein